MPKNFFAGQVKKLIFLHNEKKERKKKKKKPRTEQEWTASWLNAVVKANNANANKPVACTLRTKSVLIDLLERRAHNNNNK